jgi:hypothetical protein
MVDCTMPSYRAGEGVSKRAATEARGAVPSVRSASTRVFVGRESEKIENGRPRGQPRVLWKRRLLRHQLEFVRDADKLRQRYNSHFFHNVAAVHLHRTLGDA